MFAPNDQHTTETIGDEALAREYFHIGNSAIAAAH